MLLRYVLVERLSKNIKFEVMFSQSFFKISLKILDYLDCMTQSIALHNNQS